MASWSVKRGKCRNSARGWAGAFVEGNWDLAFLKGSKGMTPGGYNNHVARGGR